MKFTSVVGTLLASSLMLTQSIKADVFMHNPRGSNNRNCEDNENRNNNNRLFDSQNNNKGGYACPLARPFPCYEIFDETERANCNNRNNPGASTQLNENGVVDPTGVITPRMYYYEGSQLAIEWTNQHGCGFNPRARCAIVLQYACEDTLTDDCGDAAGGKTCGPRDGMPVSNTGSNLDSTATDSLPTNNNNGEQSDLRYGRHETLRYYQDCTSRERNKGLFAADQNINGNTAQFTRQNNNGARSGLECPEESEYYPYWHPSPWKDIAYLTSDLEECKFVTAESQNVKGKNFCNCPNCQAPKPNNERACGEKGGTWVLEKPFGLAPPVCGPVDTTRENHLGGSSGAGMASVFNWTLPTKLVSGQTCILRLRYNISSADGNGAAIKGDSTLNGAASPLADRNNREQKSYKEFSDIADESLRTHAVVGIAMNTNQYARTFQDRSYTFSIKPVPTGPGAKACREIYNLNVRGKRGNIVQAYPAVEYDFVPNHLDVQDVDCIHLQWTGSDYGQDRQPNNGYGGPPRATNLNEAAADRHNFVQVSKNGLNEPVTSLEEFDMFADFKEENKMRLIFLDQPINDRTKCLTATEIKGLTAVNGLDFPNNQDARDRVHLNCGKLSGQKIPYFDAGLVKMQTVGEVFYMSTRDNSFSNRDMKGSITVYRGITSPAVIGGIIGAIIGVGAIVAAAVYFRKKRAATKAGVTFRNSTGSNSGTKPLNQTSPMAGAAAAGAAVGATTSNSEKALPPPKKETKAPAAAATTTTAAPVAKPSMAVALYAHEATEPGELAFKKGDKITIIARDASGWWEGTCGKARGIFPSNYVKEL